jgi:hypothetical protein
MSILTLNEIAQFKRDLSAEPDAILALNEIERNEGNVEDAAKVILLQDTEWNLTQAEWMDELTRRCRGFICQKYVQGSLPSIISGLSRDLPQLLVDLLGVSIPTGTVTKLATCFIVNTLSKMTLEQFCQEDVDKLS